MPNPFVAYPSAGSVSAVRPGEAAAAPADANAGPGGASAGASVSVPSAPELAPIAAHLADPAVTDLFINGAAGLWCDRGDGAVRRDCRGSRRNGD